MIFIERGVKYSKDNDLLDSIKVLNIMRYQACTTPYKENSKNLKEYCMNDLISF